MKANLLRCYSHLIDDLNPLLVKLDKEYLNNRVFPAKANVFKAFQVCPYSELRVVILAMDPYPQEGYATGLAFANPKDTKVLSPSLELIKDRIKKDFYLESPADFNFDPTLESWAKQGILLLNSSLTVIENHPGSHLKIWQPFIKELLINLSKYTTGIVYLLFGKQAQQYLPFINQISNYTFCYKHPAYYARINSELKCDGFIKAYEIIKRNTNYKIQF